LERTTATETGRTGPSTKDPLLAVLLAMRGDTPRIRTEAAVGSNW
jgi:hypothetical protein